MTNGEIFLSLNSTPNTALSRYFYYMVKGEIIRIKIRGFGSNGKHLVLASSRPNIVSPEQNSKLSQLEQTVKMRALSLGIATIHSYDGRSSSGLYLPVCNPGTHGIYKNCFPTLTVNVLSEIKKPVDLNADEMALFMVLMAETQKPALRKSDYNEDETFKAMSYMRQVLFNRLSFSHPYLLGVPKNNKTLIGLIRSGGVIEGFEDYPSLNIKVEKNINEFFKSANTSQDKYFLANRRLINYAIDIAREKNITPLTEKNVYSWRTKGSGSPGQNFKKLFSMAGQDFYGLQQAFINDPLGKKK